MPEGNGIHGQEEARRFADAVAIANIPTLLMVLVQLTGDLRWLEEPYRPTRGRGMNDNDTGGFPDPIQAEIRAAALSAILDWRAGRPVAIPEPPTELRRKMLSTAMAEEVPAEYDSIIAAELFPESAETVREAAGSGGIRGPYCWRRGFGLVRGYQPAESRRFPSPSWKRAKRWEEPGGTTAIPARVSIPPTICTPIRSHPTTGRCILPCATNSMLIWNTSPISSICARISASGPR